MQINFVITQKDIDTSVRVSASCCVVSQVITKTFQLKKNRVYTARDYVLFALKNENYEIKDSPNLTQIVTDFDRGRLTPTVLSLDIPEHILEEIKNEQTASVNA